MKNKKIYIAIAILAVIILASTAKSFSNNDFKNSASIFLQGAETTGNPITLRIDSNYYYYVPFEINSTLTTQFPGIMLDKSAKAITDKALLKNLFLYPSLVKEFSSTIKDFDKLAVSKTAAFAKYCKILKVQSIKFSELNMQGNVAGILYHGTKLAFDAVGLVKSSTSGLARLIKDLAKDKVKDSVISYLTKTDSREILTSTQKADDSARNANNACKSAMTAWNALQSTTGKASPAYATAAVEQTYNMFFYEHTAMDALKTGFNRVNNYPKLITKINKKDFKKGMADLSKFISRLEDEKKYWNNALNNTTDENMLELWAEEQISRVNAAIQLPEPAPTQEPPPPPPPAACTSIDVASDYTFYTYTPDNPGTNGPCLSFANSASSNTVTLTCSTDNRFRNHWVKEINTSGLSKTKIKANLTIDDRGFFYSMCPNGGVKYDDYSILYVLSSDPRETFTSECNKVCSPDDWPKCGINPATNSSVLGKCGVAKCSTSRECELEVDSAGLNKIYLVFTTANPWPANVKGSLSNVEICPAN